MGYYPYLNLIIQYLHNFVKKHKQEFNIKLTITVNHDIISATAYAVILYFERRAKICSKTNGVTL